MWDIIKIAFWVVFVVALLTIYIFLLVDIHLRRRNKRRAMGGLLKEALKSLCGVSQWSYAVFWKIGCQNTK